MKRQWLTTTIAVLPLLWGLTACGADQNPLASRSDHRPTPILTVSTPSSTAEGEPPTTGAKTASAIAECALSTLPNEAAETVALVKKGGPFPYPRNDGVTFGNREKRLPIKARTYYREYTIKTPGSRDRGARRLITGGEKATAPEKWYYTADHYGTFCLVTGTK